MANSGLPRLSGGLAKAKQVNRLIDAIEHNGSMGGNVGELGLPITWLIIDSASGFNPVAGWYKAKSLTEGFKNVNRDPVAAADFGDPASAVDCWLINGDEAIGGGVLSSGAIIPATFACVDAETGLPAFLRIGGGTSGVSQAKLVYITENLNCGGVYEGYIVSDLSGILKTSGFSSSASTFSLSDILSDAPGIAATDAEKITIINDDEEGLTTHALTEATQVKHLYIAFDTGNTDDDQGDRRVFIITDTDNEECETA